LSGTDGTLLNANQRRRVSTHFRLLLEDLDEIAAWPELGRSGEPYDSIRETVRALRAAIESLRATLALPAHAPPPLRRRVMATAEVWATSMEDLKSRHLVAYGRLHPGLGKVLDPPLDDIVRRLQRLADLANRLPDA
jgi:hypothetical protein